MGQPKASGRLEGAERNKKSYENPVIRREEIFEILLLLCSGSGTIPFEDPGSNCASGT